MTPSDRASLAGAPDPDHVTTVTLNHPDGRARFHYDDNRPPWVLAAIEPVKEEPQ